MHPCLNTDEIVRLIACELVASKSKATAVALVCSHKAFQDPVLDALWETQEKLLPLFKTLPGDVWNKGGCKVSALTIHVSLPSTIWFESVSKDSQRPQNGPVSGGTLEGCDTSNNLGLLTGYLWKCLQFCSFPPSTNPCFRISKLSNWGSLPGASSRSSPCSFPRGPPPSPSHSLHPPTSLRRW